MAGGSFPLVVPEVLLFLFPVFEGGKKQEGQAESRCTVFPPGLASGEPVAGGEGGLTSWPTWELRAQRWAGQAASPSSRNTTGHHHRGKCDPSLRLVKAQRVICTPGKGHNSKANIKVSFSKVCTQFQRVSCGQIPKNHIYFHKSNHLIMFS